MAYDETLAQRVRDALSDTPGFSERKMFGGLCFLVGGNMCCGVVNDTLMVRVGPDQYQKALALPHAREMDFTGKPLRGIVYVDPPGVRKAADLSAWVERGLAFAGGLPPK